MGKFQVGDIVMVDREYAWSSALRGKSGVVVAVNIGAFDLCVDFDKVYDGTHDCHGRTPNYTGRFFHADEVELVLDPDKEPDVAIDLAAFEDLL